MGSCKATTMFVGFSILLCLGSLNQAFADTRCRNILNCLTAGVCYADAPCSCTNGKCQGPDSFRDADQCRDEQDCVQKGICYADAPCLCTNGKCQGPDSFRDSNQCRNEQDCVEQGICYAGAPCLCTN